MKRPVRTTVLLLTCILLLSMFVGLFDIRSINCDPAIDWWTTFPHDLTHSGYSTSTAPTTNQTLWSYTTGASVGSSPAVADGVVFVGSHDDKVYALNATDGSVVWNYTTEDSVFSSPAVVGGVVFVGSLDDNGYALDASDGSLVWNYTTGADVFSSPAVADGVVFVGSDDGNVYALNATDGSVVWSYTIGASVGSSPAVADGVVFVGSYVGKVYAFAMSYDTVGGELSQTNYIESFLVPELVMLGISGAIVMLGFVHIKRSKQTQSKPHNA